MDILAEVCRLCKALHKRHTYATLQLEAGVSLVTIQRVLGHHSPTFTAAEYGHVTKKMMQEVTSNSNNILKVCLLGETQQN